jgi:hypothetical protein
VRPSVHSWSASGADPDLWPSSPGGLSDRRRVWTCSGCGSQVLSVRRPPLALAVRECGLRLTCAEAADLRAVLGVMEG